MTTVFHPVAATARARPNHIVLHTPEGQLTALELCQRVAQLATSLAAQGVRAGNPVALLGPPSLDWVIALHAIGWLGAIVVPVGPGPGAAIDPSVAFVLACHVAPPSGRQRLEYTPANTMHPEPNWRLSDVRLWMQTSGSTGSPRHVPLTTSQLLFSAMGSTIRLGHQPEDRWLSCLPLHHIGGLSILYRCAWLGTCAEVHPRFEPSLVNRRIDTGGVTQISVVPTMLSKLLDDRNTRPFPQGLRVILLGGAAAPPALLARCRAIAAPVACTWGMTETASQVATAPPGDLPSQAGQVGPPLAFARVTAADNGQLEVEGPIVGERLRTSDAGHLDASGRVVVHGRRDRMIISGGENVDPTRVEQVLCQHPQVDSATVLGLPDATWGARVAAVLV
ncbi:MAG: AMP-binding protein, partial [Nannocystaceae bacterium]